MGTGLRHLTTAGRVNSINFRFNIIMIYLNWHHDFTLAVSLISVPLKPVNLSIYLLRGNQNWFWTCGLTFACRHAIEFIQMLLETFFRCYYSKNTFYQTLSSEQSTQNNAHAFVPKLAIIETLATYDSSVIDCSQRPVENSSYQKVPKYLGITYTITNGSSIPPGCNCGIVDVGV